MNAGRSDMTEQTVRVVRVETDGVWVSPIDEGGCGSCGGRCGARRLAELFSARQRNFLIQSTLFLQPGDRVVVGVPAGAVLTGALWLYGVPLAGVFGGAVLGAALAGSDSGVGLLGSDFAAVLGMLVGGAAAFLLARRQCSAQAVALRQVKLFEIHKETAR